MRTFFWALCFVMGAILPAIAQNPIEYRLNSNYGFSGPNGKKDIVVNFPGKTAREIFTMMAVNISVLYYQPSEVMYGVQDALVSVSGYSSDFCRNGDQKWAAKYDLKFIIQDEKVLILNPIIRNLTLTERRSLSNLTSNLSFIDFINQYWYNREVGQFVLSEANNMSQCESEISRITNQILGLSPIGIIPENW